MTGVSVLRRPAVADLLDGVASSTTHLVDWLAGLNLTDAELRAPSELPDWSRGHVLTHIARNADGMVRTISGGLRGEIVERYPGTSRDDDIESGAVRPAAEILADVRTSATGLAATFAAVDAANGWQLATAEERRADEWPLRRWREIEIHRVDLGLGYLPSSWPDSFVATVLPDLAADRSMTEQMRHLVGPDWAKLCWLTGRIAHATTAIADLPEIAPWR
jgi:maleylpyruvate isomerase